MSSSSSSKLEIPAKRSFEKTLVNIKYSNIPVNVPTILPTELKEKVAALKYFSLPNIKKENPKVKLTHYSIRRHDDQEDLGMIMENPKKALLPQNPNDKKGSMYVGELWGAKYRKGVIKTARLENVIKRVQKLEKEDLNQKLAKMERLYKRRELYENSTDASIMFEDFKVDGLNSIVLDTDKYSLYENKLPTLKEKKFKSNSLATSYFVHDISEFCSTENTNTTEFINQQLERIFSPKKKNRRLIKGRDKPLTFSLQTLNSPRESTEKLSTEPESIFSSPTKDMLKKIVNPNSSPVPEEIFRIKRSRTQYLKFSP